MEVGFWSNFQLNGLASQMPVHPKDNDTRSEQTHFQRITGSLQLQGHSKKALQIFHVTENNGQTPPSSLHLARPPGQATSPSTLHRPAQISPLGEVLATPVPLVRGVLFFIHSSLGCSLLCRLPTPHLVCTARHMLTGRHKCSSAAWLSG